MVKNNIQIRAFHFWDLPALAAMVADEWNLGCRQSGTSKRICGWLYALDVAAYGTELFVALKNGKKIGFAGYDSWKQKTLRQKIYFALFKILFYSPLVKRREIMREYYSTYGYTPHHLKNNQTCELDMLIVDKELRGSGLGYLLFEHTLQKAGRNGYHKMLIETDDSCTVSFYEKVGCRRIQTFLEDTENVIAANENRYLYEIEILH